MFREYCVGEEEGAGCAVPFPRCSADCAPSERIWREIIPSMTSRTKTHLFRLLLVALGLVVGLSVAETGARIHQGLSESPQEKRTGIRRVRSCKGCRHVFELNPRHADISSQGLRSAEIDVPKPPGRTRIGPA